MANVWFITGATRGIGAAIAKEVLAAGDKVVATGRDIEKMRQTLHASQEMSAYAKLGTRFKRE